jgi:hypothetical protein
MTIDEFRAWHGRYAVLKPKIFLLVPPDSPATTEQLDTVEREIGTRLPNRFREFLTEVGGGAFGFTNVFSANPASEFYLPTRRAKTLDFLPPNLLPFSDDFTGGWYVFKVDDSQAREAVFYWNADGGLVETNFNDVLEFVARYAYEAV